MYTAFRVKNFRCFEDLQIAPLGSVNLVGGKNNVGKTALLEALWLHHGYHNPELGIRLRAFRGLTQVRKDEFLWDLFYGFDPDRVIELESEDTESRRRSLSIWIQERPTTVVSLQKGGTKGEDRERDLSRIEAGNEETTKAAAGEVVFEYRGPSAPEPVRAHAAIVDDSFEFQRPRSVRGPSGVFLSARRSQKPKEMADRFSDLAILKREEQIVRMMKIIEPRLRGLSVQHEMVWGDLKGTDRLLPVPLMGDGMGRFLDIALAIPVAEDGILLVDEVENGLHHSVLTEIWSAIRDWAQDYNVQVFATTHSFKCIEAAHSAFKQSQEDAFRYHRLERVAEQIEAVTLSQRQLSAVIKTDLEVR